jgi:hypothetical protein
LDSAFELLDLGEDTELFPEPLPPLDAYFDELFLEETSMGGGEGDFVDPS